MLYELYYGVLRRAESRRAEEELRFFLSPFEVVPFCARSAVAAAEIRFALERKGQIIGPNDLMIAATAIAHKATVVTHNTREFSRVPNIKVADWAVGFE